MLAGSWQDAATDVDIAPDAAIRAGALNALCGGTKVDLRNW